MPAVLKRHTNDHVFGRTKWLASDPGELWRTALSAWRSVRSGDVPGHLLYPEFDHMLKESMLAATQTCQLECLTDCVRDSAGHEYSGSKRQKMKTGLLVLIVQSPIVLSSKASEGCQFLDCDLWLQSTSPIWWLRDLQPCCPGLQPSGLNSHRPRSSLQYRRQILQHHLRSVQTLKPG